MASTLLFGSGSVILIAGGLSRAVSAFGISPETKVGKRNFSKREKMFDLSFVKSYILRANSPEEYLLALAVFVGSVAAFLLGRRLLVEVSRRSKNRYDDAVTAMVYSIGRGAYLSIAAVLGLRMLNLPAWTDKVFFLIVLLVCAYYAARVLTVLIDHLGEHILQSHQDDHHAAAAAGLLSGIVKILVWVGAGLFVLANLGVNITSLIAGLGVGGLAVALALQGILKDLFASFSLFFDKPFTIGDMIDVDGNKGVVQKIGIKTTRLRSLTGEEIIVPNQDLTSARVHNYKRMRKRRVSFTVGVIYETPGEKLRKIPAIIEEIITSIPDLEFSRAHFKSFDDWALTFEVVYFVLTRDYDLYMDTRQKINLALKERFEKEGIEMAYPTSVVYRKDLNSSEK